MTENKYRVSAFLIKAELSSHAHTAASPQDFFLRGGPAPQNANQASTSIRVESDIWQLPMEMGENKD